MMSRRVKDEKLELDSGIDTTTTKTALSSVFSESCLFYLLYSRKGGDLS